DALTLAPEEFLTDLGTYTALRTAYHRTVNARDDDDLRNVADYLWEIALGLEEGDMSVAARNLRNTQEALRRALENNAPDEEISRLTEQLREAMREFMQALAEQAQRNPNMAELPPDANAQTITP